jgi:hypothetical protein
MDLQVGQVWTRGKGIWETGKRIVDIDNQRRSVVFVKTESLYGGDAKWESVGLLSAWIEDTGASLKSENKVEKTMAHMIAQVEIEFSYDSDQDPDSLLRKHFEEMMISLGRNPLIDDPHYHILEKRNG